MVGRSDIVQCIMLTYKIHLIFSPFFYFCSFTITSHVSADPMGERTSLMTMMVMISYAFSNVAKESVHKYIQKAHIYPETKNPI